MKNEEKKMLIAGDPDAGGVPDAQPAKSRPVAQALPL